MRSRHDYRFAGLMIFFLLANNCFAAAVPKYNGRMNNAVKGVVKTKMHKMGYAAANDPCFNATVSAVGAGVTTVAAGLIVGATWPAILIGAGVNALVGFAIPLAMDKGISWLFNDKGEIIASKDPQKEITELTIGDQKFPVTHNPGYGCTMSYKDYLSIPGFLNTLESPMRAPPAVGGLYRVGRNTYSYLSVVYSTSVSNLGGNCLQAGLGSNHYYPFVCYSGTFSCDVSTSGNDKTEINIPYPIYEFPDFVNTPLSVDKAIGTIPESVLQYQVSSEMLAAAANTLWQVAKPNQYDRIIPWAASNPITAEEAREWLLANPSLAPSVKDFIAPAAPGGFGSSSSPGSGLQNPNPNSANRPMASPCPEASAEWNKDRDRKPDPKPELEFAPAPGIGEPDLEDIPTAEVILAPLLNLMSDLKNFSVPSHIAVCPTSSFTVFGKEYHFRTHCDLIEQNRTLIGTTMVLAWALIALIIVLRA